MSIKTLHDLTRIFLEDTPQTNKLELSNACKKLKLYLSKIIQLDSCADESNNNMELSNGTAIGTIWAALCIEDIMRTKKFMQGISRAIEDLLSGNDELHILYAGTGPFATLILPFLSMYDSNKVKYTLIEVNPYSFELLQKTIEAFSVSDRVKLVQADASTYVLDEKVDIIITETMQHALLNEMQFQITSNLVHQAKNINQNVILIPERIDISLGLLNDDDEMSIIGDFFHLDRNLIWNMSNLPNKIFDLGNIYEHTEFNSNMDLAIFTEIHTHGEIIISHFQSELTTPYVLGRIPVIAYGVNNVRLRYIIEDGPKIDYEVF